jgi:leucyl aminopeptidase
MEADTMKSCWDLVNNPSNYKSVSSLAEWMRHSANKYAYDCRIIDKEELESLGFHALLAVNKGSSEPAKCIIGEYRPADMSDQVPTIALVGKGITFDTGGISLKPSKNMHYMKSDMGGAAAVMGAIELVAKCKLPVRLIVVVPSTDNSIGAKAIKPGDIIGSYRGHSIEIIDTDAEGRLVLADGLSYAIQKYEPDYVIDLATLTGSVIRTLGNYAAGLMTQNDDLARQLTNAGQESGERLWRLPLWSEYGLAMQSDMADIKNLSDQPSAGATTAGKFLEFFTDEHAAWAHIDIAGTSFHPNPFSKGHSATGFGILLLTQWMESLNKTHS